MSSSTNKKDRYGIISTISAKLQKKGNKMLNFKTNIPEIDQENTLLFRAAQYLETIGNEPGLTASQFYAALVEDNVDMADEDFSKLATAAIAIETMMEVDSYISTAEQTVH
ncbi:MAG: hypothetical protein NZ730_11935 [Porticoccaceae bacterium]|nr:hypothetical protein [Porticoccaceae bacterium]